jgi:hypothetical protein
MATRVKPKPNLLYDEDFYAWSRQQAAMLRDGRFAELDLGHLIEEVDDLGGALKRSVRSRIRTIIEHLLKLEHSPAQDSRGGWYDTIIAQRGDLVDELTPSLRREIEPEFAVLYNRARGAAAPSHCRHDEPTAAALPATCPYSLDQITGDWWPRAAASDDDRGREA